MTSSHLPQVHLVHRKIELVADAERISFRGFDFALASVDHIAYRQWISRLNGAYMGTQLLVRLSQSGHRDQVLLDSGSKDEHLDELRSAWQGVVDLLEAFVAPRLVEEATTAILGGDERRFGGIVASAEGVRARRPFARTIPWAQVVGTTRDAAGSLQVVVRDGRGHEKAKLLAGPTEWDVVLLPRIVARLGGS